MAQAAELRGSSKPARLGMLQGSTTRGVSALRSTLGAWSERARQHRELQLYLTVQDIGRQTGTRG